MVVIWLDELMLYKKKLIKTVFTLETTVDSGSSIPIYLNKPDTNTLYIEVNGTTQYTVGTDVSGNFNRTLTLNALTENIVKVWVNSGSYGLGNGTGSNTTIGGTTQDQRNTLKEIIIGNQVTSMSNYAVSSCHSLTRITIPNSVTSIGERAISSCHSLTRITIPNSVTSIGDYAFAYSGLISVTFGENSQLTNISSYAFRDCLSLESIIIPNSVTSIGVQVFNGCLSLESIIIPNSVTSIGALAFNSCGSLTSVTVENATPPALSFGGFNNTNNCPIYVPADSVQLYKLARSEEHTSNSSHV